jgi:leukotriene-A4 hydrolase
LNGEELKDWSSGEITYFLEVLIESKKKFSATLLEKIEQLYKFSFSNSEIRFCWFKLCLQSNYEAIFPNIVSFLKSQGRMKFVRPLYRQLASSENGKQLAIKTFHEWKENYHNICSKMVSKDLNL